MRDSKGRFKKGGVGFWSGKKRPDMLGNKYKKPVFGKDNVFSRLKFVGSAHPRWKGGKPNCEDCGKKLTQYSYRRCVPCLAKVRVDEKSPHWSGDNVGYRGLHQWVESKLGKPNTCIHCGKSGLAGRQIHWANKSRKYKRSIFDWLRLCAKCHKIYDHA